MKRKRKGKKKGKKKGSRQKEKKTLEKKETHRPATFPRIPRHPPPRPRLRKEFKKRNAKKCRSIPYGTVLGAVIFLMRGPECYLTSTRRPATFPRTADLRQSPRGVLHSNFEVMFRKSVAGRMSVTFFATLFLRHVFIELNSAFLTLLHVHTKHDSHFKVAGFRRRIFSPLLLRCFG